MAEFDFILEFEDGPDYTHPQVESHILHIGLFSDVVRRDRALSQFTATC
jgi:hypothetical protein